MESRQRVLDALPANVVPVAQRSADAVAAAGAQTLAKRPLGAWEKQVLSARGFKRVGRHS